MNIGCRFYAQCGLWLALTLLGALGPAAAQHRRRTEQPGRSAGRNAGRPAKAPARSTATRRATERPNQAARSKEQLERERRQNLRQLKATSRALTQTKARKKASLGELNVIKERLTVKKEVITSISTQLHGIENNVQRTAAQVLQTQKSLAELKAEYARMLYTASKTASGFNRLMFLFAADSFNEFALRLRYIRQYTQERQQQALRIVGAQSRLNQQLSGLTVQQQRKSRLLTTQLSENRSLLTLKTQQDDMVSQLSQQEQGLRQKLAEQQQAVHRLDNLIADRVRAEITRAARAARLANRGSRSTTSRSKQESGNDPTAAPENDAPETAAEAAADRRANRIALTPETALASTKFSGNKGRLPWPVGRGFVSQHFGQHPHPVLKNVVVDNRGVDIQTAAGEAVRSVFDGKILTITNIPGMNTIVMVQHGDFFTVYAKLSSVSVREGQQVSAREPIGTVAADADGTSEVQFQIWHNSANLNPESWLGRK